MRIDLHNHTSLCNHATGSMEDYIKRAIELKIDIFGFSCHAPMDFEPEYRMSLSQSKVYEKDILDLKEKYKNDIKICLGYEVDFMSNSKFLEKDILNSNVDYLIGSVHFIDKWGFDNPEFIGKYKDKDINIEVFNGDARKYIKELSNIHIVYQDAFSSDVNKSLWTKEYFNDIYKLLAKDAIITTYSIATPIRLSMWENGLFIYEYKNNFTNRITVATKDKLEIESKNYTYIDMELKKQRNPLAKPLLD